MNQRQRVLDHGQTFEPEEIHLEQAKIVQRTHRILADHVVAFDVAAERDVIGQIAIGDDDTGRVHPGIAREALERLRVFEQLFRLWFGRDRAFQFRIFFRGRIECNIQLVWNHPRDPIGRRVGKSHYAANVTHHALRFQLSERDNLRDATLAILLANILQNFAAARFAKIDIDIGRRNTVRIEKALKDQSEL